MDTVIETLLEAVEQDRSGTAGASSHWHQHADKTLATWVEGRLVLRASGFSTLAHPRIGGRVLGVLERLSYWRVTASMRHFSQVWKMGCRLARELSGGPDFHVFNQVCALAVLADHWDANRLSPSTFALIGDGEGFLGALIARWLPTARLYAIDLPKGLVFQASLHARAHPLRARSVFDGTEAGPSATVFVRPQAIEQIPGPIDCAINMASMQEMTTDSIAAYFTLLRGRSRPWSRFYCVNRLKKTLVGGEVSSFSEYPWQVDDAVFLDGLCPYYTHYWAPYTRPEGPHILGRRIPCLNYFDGPHVHRLVHLAPRA